MPKMALLDCARTRHLPSFFFPTPEDLTAQLSPPPGISHPREKNVNVGGQPRGGGWGRVGLAQLELTDALLPCPIKAIYRGLPVTVFKFVSLGVSRLSGMSGENPCSNSNKDNLQVFS